jgi:photosystem II stability/assembly factor-like uncharacterized protein
MLKKVIAALVLVAVSMSIAQWYPEPSGTTLDLYCVQALWAMGEDGTILFRRLGVWEQRTSPTSNELYGVHWPYACGDYGTILRYNTSSLIWELLNTGSSAHLRDIWYQGNANIIAVGIGGVILKSTNAGQTWAQKPSGTSRDLQDVHWESPVLLVVGEAGTILSSTDGGETWRPMNSGTTEDLYGVCPCGTQLHLACGRNGTVIRSTDGGLNWFRVESGTGENLLDIASYSPHSYIVGTAGTILESWDRGQTWQAVASGTPYLLWGVRMSSSLDIAVGANGTILCHEAVGMTEPPRLTGPELTGVGLVVRVVGSQMRVNMRLPAGLTDTRVIVTSAAGRAEGGIPLVNGSGCFDMTELAAGVHFVTAHAGTRVLLAKVVKLR